MPQMAPQFVQSMPVYTSVDYASMFYTFIGVMIAVVAFWMFIMFCMLAYCVYSIFVGKQTLHDLFRQVHTFPNFCVPFVKELHSESVPVFFEGCGTESKKPDPRLDGLMQKRDDLRNKRGTLEDERAKLYDNKWKEMGKSTNGLTNDDPKIKQELDDSRQTNIDAGKAEGMVFPKEERIKLFIELIDEKDAQILEIWSQINEVETKISECEK